MFSQRAKSHREVVDQVVDRLDQAGILVGMVVREVVFHLVQEVLQTDQEPDYRLVLWSRQICPRLQGHLFK